MCTRFFVELQSYRSLIKRAQKMELASNMMLKLSKPLTMAGELRPTDVAAVLAPNKDGKMAVFPMIWGFNHKASDTPIVNCRLETADKKDIWKDSWYRRRCIIPASWYYEWEHIKSPDGTKYRVGDKYMIQTRDSITTLLAGLYRIEKHRDIQVPVFSVITRDAVGDLRSIHDRMPVVIRREDISDWIRPDGKPYDVAERAVSDLYYENLNA